MRRTEALNYFFQSAAGRRLISGTSTGTVLRNQTLSIADFENLVIPLPDFGDQRHLAGMLNEAFERVERIRELRQRAVRLADALPQSFFEHFLSDNTIEHRRLGAVLKLERIPVTIDPDGRYTQIGIRSFGRGIFHRDPVLGADLGKLRYFEVYPGRLIVSNIMAWEGAVAVSSDNDSGCVGSNRFLSYVPLAEIDLNYVSFFFQSKLGKQLIKGSSTGTVLRNQTLSMRDFENLVIPFPDLSVQRQISEILGRVYSDSAIAGSQEYILRALRASMVNSVFSGQL